MNLSPIPARLPARKHLLAGAVACLSVALMLVAVLGTAGLPTPFSAGDSTRIRTGAVEFTNDALTTPGLIETEPAGSVSPAPGTGPATTTRRAATTSTPSVASSGPSPTTTTTLVPGLPTTTVPEDPTDDLLGGLGLGRGLLQP